MVELICLHGFLGSTTNWNFLEPALKNKGLNVRVSTINMWNLSHLSIGDFAAHLASKSRDDQVICGYSMGGRLAGQCFIHEQSRHRALISISAHPGNLDKSIKESRLTHDHQWASRFETDPWDTLMTAWNSQPVFSNDTRKPSQSQGDFNRSHLSSALRNWSVALQKNVHPILAQEDRPILWIAGEQDHKYAKIARQTAALNHQIKAVIIKEASHRLLTDAPTSLVHIIADFLATI